MSKTEQYHQEFCNNCSEVTLREVSFYDGNDHGGRTSTEYCKKCKQFNHTETDANGKIVRQQIAI